MSAPRVRVLAPSHAGVRIEGMDEHTIRMEPFGAFVNHPLDRIFRGEDWPLAEGQVVELSGLTVTVEKVVNRIPA